MTTVANCQSAVFCHCMFALLIESKTQMKQMQQSTLKTQPPDSSHLYAIVCIKKYANDLERYTEIAWNFVYSSLWMHSVFSSKEIHAAKEKITLILCKGKNIQKSFFEFCQRVILSRQHINNLDYECLSFPSLWLDIANSNGYAASKDWYNEIKDVRKSLPEYLSEIKALADAVYDCSKEPTEDNIKFWRGYFIEKEKPVLLNMFLVNLLHQQYNFR